MPTILESRAADNSAQERTVANFSVDSAEVKAGKWLASLVKEAKDKGKPVSRIVDLTPALAQVLLNRNDGNRKVSQNVVDIYAREIATGSWEFNGEPVIISDTGELNDGQHRCMAVIEAGQSIEAILIAGVARSTRTTLNRGKVRTVADYLSMNGHINTCVLGAAANNLWQWRNRGKIGGSFRTGATKSEILDTVSDNPGLARSVAIVEQKSANVSGGKSILAFCHFAFLNVGKREDADQFILSLINGDGLKNGDPILYCRNRLINERGRMRQNERAELIFRAWNAWRRGERVSRIQLSCGQGGELPLLEA